MPAWGETRQRLDAQHESPAPARRGEHESPGLKLAARCHPLPHRLLEALAGRRMRPDG